MSNCKINRVAISTIIGLTLVLLGSGQRFCPEGWTWYEADYCVKLLNTEVPKEFALGMCQLESTEASLASFTSTDEQAYLTELVFYHNQSDKSIWTGGVLKSDASGFQWQDGTEIPRLSPLWDTGFPSLNRNRGCVQMSYISGKLQDVSCSGTRNYILCQLFAPWVKLARENKEHFQEINQLKRRVEELESSIGTPSTPPPPLY